MQWSNRPSSKRVGKIVLMFTIMTLNYNVVEVAKNSNNVFEFSKFSQNGPCDMCWGDLSL